MQKWEYLLEASDNFVMGYEYYNQRGEEGWELVTIVQTAPESGAWFCVFKRLLIEE